MKHQLLTKKGNLVTVKCSPTGEHDIRRWKDEVTVWWSEVDCPECRPYAFEGKDKLGKKMVKRGQRHITRKKVR